MDTEAEKAHFVTKLETHHLLILTPIPQLKGNLDEKILVDETLSPRCIEVYVIWSIVGLEESPSFLLEYLQTTYYILYQKYSLHYIYIHKFCFLAKDCVHYMYNANCPAVFFLFATLAFVMKQRSK